GIPLAYNKDMQEDKEMAFDGIDTVQNCIALFTGMLKTVKWKKERMEESAKKGFSNATDAADYLVKKGVPFRDAHEIVGRLVLYCMDKGGAIDDLSMEEFHRVSPIFEQDIFEAVSLKACVERRCTLGAPGKEAMEKVISIYETYFEEEALL
ncbi:argininosuccinate lyase, partial [bacterium 1XD42-8]